MPIVLLMGIFVVVAVGAAELVRLQCRRMLKTPGPRRPLRQTRQPRLASVPLAVEPAPAAFATASAA